MKRLILGLAVLVFTSTGCLKASTAHRIDQLEQRVVDLSAEVAVLKNTTPPPTKPEAAAPTPEQELEAKALFQRVVTALGALQPEVTKTLFAELKTKYSHTAFWKRASRQAPEIEVLGRAAPALKVSKWYLGNTKMTDGKATLVVFWEKWCPHCRRELPNTEETYQQYKDRGLNVVALTKASRGVTDADIQDFISTTGITFPTAKDGGGQISAQFGVSGIPAAALVKDGKVIWRGHPQRITSDMVDQLLQ